MASSHEVGGIRGTRLGGQPVIHSLPVTFADAPAVAKKLLTIDGSVFEPMAFRIVAAVVMAVFNGTTSETLSVGIVGATYVDLINAQSVWTGVTLGTNLSKVFPEYKIVTAPTDVYALLAQGGTAPTAGLVHVMIEVWPVNIQEPSSIGT